MAHPITKVPTDKTVQRDFETGTVQPGPGMAPDRPPAQDMQGAGASEEFRQPGAAQGSKEQPGTQQKSSGGSCGCHCG